MTATYKPGPVETEGEGTGEILFVTDTGRPLVKHADGEEILHYQRGSEPDGRSSYNLKPQISDE